MNIKIKRPYLILIALIATPLICLLLGILAESMSSHIPNDDGTDWSVILPAFGFFMGLVGSCVGAIIGLITTVITRNSKQKLYATLAYLLPPSAAVLYMLFGTVFMTS